MKNINLQLMDSGSAFAAYVSETPVLLILGVALALAVWRYGGKSSRQN